MPIPEPQICNLEGKFNVGQAYPAENENGTVTANFRITSIDTVNCNICFTIEDSTGQWDILNGQFSELNTKIFFNATEYCVINPSENSPTSTTTSEEIVIPTPSEEIPITDSTTTAEFVV